MNWFRTGLPLALVGCLNLWLSTRISDGRITLMVLAFLYFAAAFCALSRSRTVRKAAVVAWFPLLLIIPIGTIFGLLAIQLLLDNPKMRHETKSKVRSFPPEQVEELIRTKARLMLEISDDNFDDAIERTLKVPPVELINFLDELNIDFGLPVSSDDRGRIDSVNDIVHLVATRLPNTVE